MSMNKTSLRNVWLTLFALVITLILICCCGMRAHADDAIEFDDYDSDILFVLDDPMYFMEGIGEERRAAAEESGADSESDEEMDDSSDPQDSEDPGEAETPDPSDHTEPTIDPTEVPTEEPTEQPTEEPTEAPAALDTLFSIKIKVPSDWTNAKSKSVQIRIVPLAGVTSWESVQYRMDGGSWTKIKEPFTVDSGEYYTDIDITANGTLTVRLSADDGQYMDEKKEIKIFDHMPPTVTAGFNDKLLHVEALDDLSGTAGAQVNGLLFTTLENGKLDVRMEDVLLTYKQLAIRAYDYAGNFSDPITLDNPYYVSATPTPKPTAKPTKKPTSQATATPEVTQTPTEKPGKTKPSPVVVDEDPVATAEPVVTQMPFPIATQEPMIIYVTQEPVATPEPIVKTEYVPIGPGQPYTTSGNMQTLDVLYSAATNKQFITVQSRAGQTYYLVIDYDKPIDEENEIYETYFLNLVDDRDLMSVLTDEEIIPTPTPEIIYVTPEPTTIPAPTAAPEPEKPEKPAANNQTAMLALLVLLVGGIGGAVWYFRKKKNSAPRNRMIDESGFDDDDDEEEESEEEPESDNE